MSMCVLLSPKDTMEKHTNENKKMSMFQSLFLMEETVENLE